jgi:hypothetical protein
MEDTEFRPTQLSPLVRRAPVAAGPLGPGPRAAGPLAGAQLGPRAAGPTAAGPLGPRAAGPLAAGPLGLGPRAAGPMATGPVARPAAGAGAHPAKAKPDPRPMRIAFFAGGLAAVSALLTAIVIPAKPAVVTTVTNVQQQTVPLTTGTPISVQQPIQYIQLLPGQTAPPGAIVVDPSGPRPTSVVISVPAPAQKGAAAQKPIIIRTTQSGKVIP